MGGVQVNLLLFNIFFPDKGHEGDEDQRNDEDESVESEESRQFHEAKFVRVKIDGPGLAGKSRLSGKRGFLNCARQEAGDVPVFTIGETVGKDVGEHELDVVWMNMIEALQHSSAAGCLLKSKEGARRDEIFLTQSAANGLTEIEEVTLDCRSDGEKGGPLLKSRKV